MRAPKCLKCGGEHWSREPCAKAAGAPKVAPAVITTIRKAVDEIHANPEKYMPPGVGLASPTKGSEGGLVQIQLADRDQVSNTVQVRTDQAQAEVGSLPARSLGSDIRERPEPKRGKPAIVLVPEAEALRIELERVSGLKVRLFDPAKTRAYNRVYMADRRAGKKPRKNGGK